MDKKQEELGKLYALRAGLSVISQKNDVYMQNDKESVRKRSVLENKFKYKDERIINSEYFYNVGQIEKEKKQMEQEKKESDSLIKHCNMSYNLWETVYYIVLILSCILLCIGIITVLVALINIESFPSHGGFGVIGIPGGSMLIIFIVVPIRDKKRIAKEKRKEALKHRIRKDDFDNFDKKIKIEKELVPIKYEELEMYKLEKNKLGLLLDEVETQQDLIVNQCRSIQNVLLKGYSGLLDARDWENLDLVIYYYETRRADSIKEALQLVDMERRNNELINSIKYASNEICRTIRSSIQELGEVLVAGFNSLSAQLEAQRVQTMGALQQINQGISGVLTQQTLNNALLAKANVSSRQMVEQMKTLNNKLK